MKNTPENKVKAAIHSYLKKLPHSYWFSAPMGAYNKSGVADILGCYKGQFVAFEVKSPEAFKKPGLGMAPNQWQFKTKVHAAKGWPFVVASLDSVKECIGEIDCFLGTSQYEYVVDDLMDNMAA